MYTRRSAYDDAAGSQAALGCASRESGERVGRGDLPLLSAAFSEVQTRRRCMCENVAPNGLRKPEKQGQNAATTIGHEANVPPESMTWLCPASYQFREDRGALSSTFLVAFHVLDTCMCGHVLGGGGFWHDAMV